MRVYLDNCTFNRPFDDQSQPRIRLETEAKLEIQRRIQAGTIELAWSYILDYENDSNPYLERREAIARWRTLAVTDIEAGEALPSKASKFSEAGVPPKDALHLACAVEAGCKFLLTTDDRLLRKSQSIDIINVLNPIQWILEVDRS